MVQRTFRAKGLPYVSELALENVKAMKALVQWNHEHGIRFFRYTSCYHLLLPKLWVIMLSHSYIQSCAVAVFLSYLHFPCTLGGVARQ